MGERPPESDAAWTAVDLKVPPDVVFALVGDPALVLRLNPCLEFDHLDAGPGGVLRIAAQNESNGRRLDTEARFVADPERRSATLRYARGLKRETRFAVTPVGGGARLTITEVYAPPAEAPTEVAGEVDRSLLPWTAALRRHLERAARYGRLPGYAWLASRFWPSMAPRQRRVAWLIIWTTAVEFLFFLGVLAVYVAAQ